MFQTCRKGKRFEFILINSFTLQWPSTPIYLIGIISFFSIISLLVRINTRTNNVSCNTLMFTKLMKEVKVKSWREVTWHINRPISLLYCSIPIHKISIITGRITSSHWQICLENISSRVCKTVLYLKLITKTTTPASSLIAWNKIMTSIVQGIISRFWRPKTTMVIIRRIEG